MISILNPVYLYATYSIESQMNSSITIINGSTIAIHRSFELWSLIYQYGFGFGLNQDKMITVIALLNDY